MTRDDLEQVLVSGGVILCLFEIMETDYFCLITHLHKKLKNNREK